MVCVFSGHAACRAQIVIGYWASDIYSKPIRIVTAVSCIIRSSRRAKSPFRINAGLAGLVRRTAPTGDVSYGRCCKPRPFNTLRAFVHSTAVSTVQESQPIHETDAQVANHVGAESEATFFPGAHYGPFEDPDDFHPRCYPKDWENQRQVETCKAHFPICTLMRTLAESLIGWLGPEMPDLNTESPKVIKTLHQWLATMVNHFDIDFIRVDTLKHVRKDFWPDFVGAGGVPAIGEVLHGGEHL
jgi:hypothetical protein